MAPRHARPERPCPGTVKTLVIGAGYTGLAAARRIAELEPQGEVLVLDAGVIGEGASGRNSGFLAWLPNRPVANRHGNVAQTAARQMRIYKAGVDWLRDLVTRHGIECDWDEHAPRFSAAATEPGAQSLKATAERYKEWGLECSILEQTELQERIGTDYYKFGYCTPYNVFVQPAALIRGLADSLPENVQLIENRPVLRIREGKPHMVVTADGEIQCHRIIVANNSFARHLGLLSSRLITIYTYAGLTTGLEPDELDKLGSERTWGVIPAHRLGSTLRKVSDGRFMLRSAYSYESELPPQRIAELLKRLYQNRYPHMRTHDFESVWGGCTALTLNGAPYFGSVRPGVYASAGCNGAGVLRGSIQGKLLAELACGLDSELLADQMKLAGPSWIPPEPLRRLGVLTTIAMERRKAGLEQ